MKPLDLYIRCISILLISVFSVQNLAWAERTIPILTPPGNDLIATSENSASSELSDSSTLDLKLQSDQLRYRLDEIASYAKTNRIVSGVILLTFGAGFGVAAATIGPSNFSNYSTSDSVYLGIISGLFVVFGGLILAIPSEMETKPEHYRLLPEGSLEELKSKINYGEMALQGLADDARQERQVSGGLLIAIGAAEIALYAGTVNSYGSSAFWNQYLLYSGILWAGLGIITFFIESKSESEYRNYLEWKNDHIHGPSKVSFNLKPVIAPVPGGVLSGVSIQF